ncbi:hypothetical protein JX265_009915 [Neoarthrinium moseri]|uniref:D-3-phosphoglycerate dehydrogenase n=1 Tax=Neoarthrinium moseri TaxID=1658444 RepID=A0A9P9WFH7_9PEZI|nr:uncharacterized protein JN550_008554 [Neoarthrinium moseri]KAI1843176.1 hypothetical protein JX266_010703 [Neoarthrinium moseri]KAI1860516.1 hypothetical protein JX265_009915 [Neoarthrinium moseri]KAI1865008.1 hypothetical protein JN550_008554 [Neoarthrinium moseri]
MAPGILSEPEDSMPRAKPTVYVMDKFHPSVLEFTKENFNAITLDMPEHAEWKQKAQYLLIRSSRLTAEDIAACPNLVAIGKQGVGIDKIDADACAARGIKIFNTPGVNARAVAELVLTLAMAVGRDVGRIAKLQAEGQVVPKETCKGLILHGKTIGIIGMGNIGKTVGQMFRGAFNAPVIAYDPYMPADAWQDLEHTRVNSVEEVLRDSDVVTVHVPLTPSTRNLISYAQLKTMKKTAIVINTARGGIINEADLQTALEEGLIWGAGLDCHEQEPPSQEKYGRLWELGVVSTPHIGAATEQTQIETGTAAAKYLLEFASRK